GAPDACASETATVTITAVNDAPAFATNAPDTATEDVTYAYAPAAFDLDGPDEAWAPAAAHTCGGTIGGDTGAFAFTPAGPTPPASCVVALEVCDGGTPDLCDTQTATVTITAVNEAPTISSTAPTTAEASVAYAYDATVTDADGPGAAW